MKNGTRVGIFCDVPSLWFAAKNCGNDRVDYERLKTAMAGGRDVSVCRAYLWQREGRGSLQGFRDALIRMGYDVIVLDHGTDIKPVIARDIAESKCEWDTLALATGEGHDYMEMFHRLYRGYWTMEVHTFDNELECDIFDEMTDKVKHVPIGPESLQSWAKRIF